MQMQGVRALAVALFAIGILAVAAAPAHAAGKVTPKLECIFVTDASSGAYTAIWGYENNTGAVTDVPIGTSNKFDPKPENRGQPTRFEVGRKLNVFTVDSDGSALVWKLPGGSATANKNSKKCDSPPVPQGNDSPQAFVLVAAAAGVVVVGAGASGWMFRRRRRTA
jgi:hypothetical protein